MKKLLLLLCCLTFLLGSVPVSTNAKLPNFNKGIPTQEYFDVNLNGYGIKVLDDFVLENINKNKITPLTKIFFELLRREQQWIFEPRLYIKGDKAYVHFVKKNGLNVLYSLKKVNESWEVASVQKKTINRIPVPKDLLQQAFIERMVEPISKAISQYYGSGKLWYRGFEKVLSIEKDETHFIFFVTVQVTTFEGPHNPPYGEETIRFRIKGGGEVEQIGYEHRDITKEELSKIQVR
ncbi:DUF3888 domain-containing protein [Brevibacillus sp. NRS-1366]|uniref:DUF3888 domain-containing protein n=1 Tax=Brevibacillus sp. NRS-1366 TaxID=3233899 RepID=UPI003D1F0C8F